MITLNWGKMALKLAGITVVSFGFGAVMGMFMSSFELNASAGVDTDRTTRS